LSPKPTLSIVGGFQGRRGYPWFDLSI